MDMSGEYRIPAPRQTVWEALNDPEVLRQSIPGCEQLDRVGEDEMTARVRAKVGPVSATFNGKVRLGELNPPESYTISGEGSGGVAGFAKGGANVRLAEDGAETTVLTYDAKADVGGKLAQIGSRLIQGTAKKMADDFFGRFSKLVAEGYAAGVSTHAQAEAAPPAPPLEIPQAAPSTPAAGLAPPAPPAPAPAPAFEPPAVDAALPQAPAAAMPEITPEPAGESYPAEPPPAIAAGPHIDPTGTIRPDLDARPVGEPAATGLFERPLTWVVVAIVALALLYYFI